MGTWSIEPSSSLVSIDQNGELTYQEHTEDTDYTIKYEDDVCGTISKSIKLKGCTPPPPPGNSRCAPGCRPPDAAGVCPRWKTSPAGRRSRAHLRLWPGGSAPRGMATAPPCQAFASP